VRARANAGVRPDDELLIAVRTQGRQVAPALSGQVDSVPTRVGVTQPGRRRLPAIAGLIGSEVEYRRMYALDGRELGERFDLGCASEPG
jgi:hypothetical protein